MKENKWLELDYSENLKEDFKRLINENRNNKIYIKLIDRNRNKIILIEDLSFAGIKKLQITSGFQDFEKIVFKNCVFGNLELIHDTFGNSIFFDDSRSEKDSRILLEESLVMHQIRVEIIRKEIESEKIDGEESKSKLKLNIKNNNQYYDEDKFLSIETGIPAEIISDKSQLYLKNCIFKNSNKIILNKYSDNRFEGCEFKGLKNEININNLLRNNFKKCTFEGNDLIINGLKEERLFNIEIEGGIFNLNFIKINRASINFKNVNFQCAKFFVEKNEDLEHEFGLMKISSNLFFSGGDYNFFELTDFGSNSFKFRNCNNINYLSFKNGAKAIEINNCSITNSTFNGEITEKAIFNNVTFTNPPNIGDIKFKNCNVEFRDIKFIDKNSLEAIAGFRALNKACRDANYHHGEIFFHGLELETRFNMLVERSYLFKFFLFLKGFFSKNIKPVNSNNGVEKINNISNGDNNIKVIQQDTSKTYKKNYINVINSIKDFLSIFLRKILIFLKKNFQLIANFFQSKLVYFIKYISYFIISFFIISKDGIERFLLSFHRLFSDFGRSLLSPLFCLVVISIFVWGLNFTQINSSKNITEDLINNECEIIKINVNELPKINSKIVFKNAFGPLQLALPKDFISDCESKFYNQNSNLIIYFLNFVHAVISSGIWFIWFFMIRARFKL